MAQNLFFSATVQKSPASLPAKIMVEHQVNRAVYFVLRGGTDEQRDDLASLLQTTLLTRVPLPRARREMWVCRCNVNCTTEEHIRSYRTVLEHVFGPTCRVTVRCIWGHPDILQPTPSTLHSCAERGQG